MKGKYFFCQGICYYCAEELYGGICTLKTRQGNLKFCSAYCSENYQDEAER